MRKLQNTNEGSRTKKGPVGRLQFSVGALSVAARSIPLTVLPIVERVILLRHLYVAQSILVGPGLPCYSL